MRKFKFNQSETLLLGALLDSSLLAADKFLCCNGNWKVII